MSPTYKWITLYLGYRSMTFSKFTLAGATFLGTGIELKPGKFRLAAMYGRFQKAIEADSLADDNRIPSYKRTGYGAKIGYGSRQSFCDLIVFKAYDDTSSLKKAESRDAVMPADNFCVGINTRSQILKSLSVDAEAGISAFTRDSRLPELESIDNKAVETFKFLFIPRSSSRLNYALSTGANFAYRIFGLRLQFQRIEPDYQTLGAYYFTSDVQSVTIAPSLNLMKKTLRLSLSMGYQTNNLDNSKLATTERKIGSVNINWIAGPNFSIALQYGNYGMERSDGRRPLADSLKTNNVSQNFTISPSLTFKTGDIIHSTALTVASMDQSGGNGIDNSNISVNFSQSLGVPKADVQFGASMNYSNTNSTIYESSTMGVTISASKKLFQRKLGWNGSANYSRTNQMNADASSTVNLNNSLNYKLSDSDALTANLLYMTSDAGTANGSSFQEIRFNLNYNRRFAM